MIYSESDTPIRLQITKTQTLQSLLRIEEHKQEQDKTQLN
jgi:hypothetical protein